MEIDETVPHYTVTDSIESKVQSMQLNYGAEMEHKSNEFVFGLDRNVMGVHIHDNSETEELNENAKAFLQLQKEREDTTFSRTCLFCKKHFTGNRSLLLDHLTEQHAFFLGQPDNIVYINEFLDILENMLNKLQCLYCEKTFKDWVVLKEHMRKKMHKRISPQNKIFDKFYMCNYVNEFQIEGINWQNADEDIEIQIGPMDTCIICLFCDNKFSDFDEIMNHLKVIHDFDFRYIKREYKLCFYSQVKLINYIRRMVLAKKCIICEIEFKSKEDLAKHLTSSRHIKILPPQSKWDQPEYFFSTLETDYLICNLEDDDDDDGNDSNIEIISEDINLPKTSILSDETLRRELL